MSLEFSNFNQNQSSEDALSEMNRLIPKTKNYLYPEPILKQYEEKLIQLMPSLIELESYIKAKENISKVQNQFHKIIDNTHHINLTELEKIKETIKKYKQKIGDYEQQHNVPIEGGLDREKESLKELRKDIKNLNELQNQFDEELKNYKKN